MAQLGKVYFYSKGGSGGSGGSGGGGGVGDGGAPKFSDFKKNLENELDTLMISKNGVLTSEDLRNAMDRVKVNAELEGKYQADYVSYYNTLQQSLRNIQEQEAVMGDEALMNGQDLAKNLSAVNYGMYNIADPSYFLAAKVAAFDDVLNRTGEKPDGSDAGINRRIELYKRAGFDTSKLEKAKEDILKQKESIDSVIENLQAVGGDVSKMNGYSWAVRTNPVTGAFESMDLKPESEIGEKQGKTNLSLGGRPVFMDVHSEGGVKYIKVQGQPNLTYDEDTKTWNAADPTFRINSIRTDKYPNQKDGTLANGTDGSTFYKMNGEWYKFANKEAQDKFIKETRPMGGSLGNMNIQSMPDTVNLSEDQTNSLGSFAEDKIITNDFFSKPMSQPTASGLDDRHSWQQIGIVPSLFESSKAGIKQTIRNAGMLNEKMSYLNPTNNLLRGLETGINAGSKIAEVAPKIPGMAAGLAKNIESGVRQAIPQVSAALGSEVQKTQQYVQSNIVPRKDSTMQQNTGLKGMFNRAVSLFRGI